MKIFIEIVLLIRNYLLMRLEIIIKVCYHHLIF